MRILLIEDDTILGSAVRDHIAADNHPIDWVTYAIVSMKLVQGALNAKTAWPAASAGCLLRELRRIDIPTPQSCIVHELAIHTVGGAVAPGERLMLFVPIKDILVVEARFHPANIDQLYVAQQARL